METLNDRSRPTSKASEAPSEARPDPPRILEFGLMPLVTNAFPERTTFLDTRLRWADVRTRAPRSGSLAARVLRLARRVAGIGHACLLQDYDIVVARCVGPVNSAGRAMPVHAALSLLGLAFRGLVLFAARGPRVRLAILDVTDHLTIHPRDRSFLRRCDLFFKRELAANPWNTLETVLPRGACAGHARQDPACLALRAKLRPFALGIEAAALKPPVPASARRYDLFYAGSAQGIAFREALAGILPRLAARGWRVHAPTHRLSREAFADAIARSRFCLSPGGVGWDCYRHYEVAALGSVPIFDTRPLTGIEPFLHGREGFYLDPQEDLERALDSLLRTDDAAVDRMTAAAQALVTRVYTFDALARYVIAETLALGPAPRPAPSAPPEEAFIPAEAGHRHPS
ncbi:glycosyltransferase family protein [Methylorubrum thiocyanatum]|uniref:glycosyltransferase family protein n=1 Tax=Methylorubrum thiocyanatum TaxID=47958 RepID=UPI003F815025